MGCTSSRSIQAVEVKVPKTEPVDRKPANEIAVSNENLEKSSLRSSPAAKSTVEKPEIEEANLEKRSQVLEAPVFKASKNDTQLPKDKLNSKQVNSVSETRIKELDPEEEDRTNGKYLPETDQEKALDVNNNPVSADENDQTFLAVNENLEKSSLRSSPTAKSIAEKPEIKETDQEKALDVNNNPVSADENDQTVLENHIEADETKNQITPIEEDKLTAVKSKVSKRLKRSDLIPTFDIFKDVDNHALQAPAEVKDSFEKLSEYLTKPFDSDLFKFRAVWRWVTANIEYDVDSYFNHSFGSSTDKNQVLQNGKAVCDGYASITNEISRCFGLETVKVSGWAKGYSYQPGAKIVGTKANHSWNAVKIENQWWLFDSTWGTGYINNNKKFEWSYTEHYFMTDPAEFIYDHFPIDPEWQLLDKKVTKEEYQSWAKFFRHFFTNGLKPLSHKEGFIQNDTGQVEIVLEVTQPTLFTSNMEFGDDLDGSKELKEYTFNFQKDNRAYFLANLPKEGNYYLKIFVKPDVASEDQNKTYQIAVTYKIECRLASHKCTKFPKIYSKWRPGYLLNAPLQGELSSYDLVHFDLVVPDAENVVVSVKGARGAWEELTLNNEGSWEGDVVFSSDATDATVVAKYQDSKSYLGLLRYTIVSVNKDSEDDRHNLDLI